MTDDIGKLKENLARLEAQVEKLQIDKQALATLEARIEALEAFKGGYLAGQKRMADCMQKVKEDRKAFMAAQSARLGN